MYACVCVCMCVCVCVRMCIPRDVSSSWCGASLLRPCPVYFLRPRYSTISCNLSFSSSSSSAWMQLVKYCVLKQSCLRRGQRSGTERSISPLMNYRVIVEKLGRDALTGSVCDRPDSLVGQRETFVTSKFLHWFKFRKVSLLFLYNFYVIQYLLLVMYLTYLYS